MEPAAAARHAISSLWLRTSFESKDFAREKNLYYFTLKWEVFIDIQVKDDHEWCAY